ncbi:MAG: thioredoxin domain-containing protein [Planctomycetota bacterium]
MTHAPDRPANRLASASSPYLLQHAHNPVDWYEWGDEAFQAARERDVPIFLSVGYATCYWCHVMERESFESEATAAVMNDRFVCIKLDREQRPDVDDLYMAATQIMTGHGGWPMSVFLEPGALRPFYCGTYFPPVSRHNLPSFEQVLTAMSEAWRDDRDKVLKQATAVADAVTEQLGSTPAGAIIGAETVQQTVGTLLRIADDNLGGFSHAPKFPQPVYLDLLLDVRRDADGPTRQAIDRVARLTLDQMMIGGMHDQLAAGFHRYSVDATWTVPHFEKMLYDNAQLASTYAAAARLYSDDQYTRTALRTAEWIRRAMTLPGGGFASAIDAEVNAREGQHCLWSPDEVRAVLDDDDAQFAIDCFGLDAEPNFQDPHHPDDAPRHVLRLRERPDAAANRLGLEPDAYLARVDRVSQRLLEVRRRRPQPTIDDKAIASWNGLAIAALADVAELTRDSDTLQAAAIAAEFVRRELVENGPSALSLHVRRSTRAGVADTAGFLEDAACVAIGLIRLWQVSRSLGTEPGDSLETAERIIVGALDRFVDPENSRPFDSPADAADLFVRGGSTYDGAMPSGASHLLRALVLLADATANQRWLDEAQRILVALSGRIAESPVATVNSVRTLYELIRQGRDVEGSLRSQGIEAPMPDQVPPAEELPEIAIYADSERVQLTTEAPAAIDVRLVIPEGHHIIVPSSDADDLVQALRIDVLAESGVAVFADYPSGDPLDLPGFDRPTRVLHGEVDITVMLERRAAPEGLSPARPVLAVWYQLCTETECLPPTVRELDVAIDLVDT